MLAKSWPTLHAEATPRKRRANAAPTANQQRTNAGLPLDFNSWRRLRHESRQRQPMLLHFDITGQV